MPEFERFLMMPPRFPISALAALSFGFVSPVTAQNNVHDPDLTVSEIDVEVQKIAVLKVIDGKASTTMDDPNPTIAGEQGILLVRTSMAQLELGTTFCVGVEIDFPTTVGVRPFPSSNYGRATGVSNGRTLGVQPFVRIANSALRFGNTSDLSGSDTDAPMAVSAETSGLCDGHYDIFLGLVTRWDLTLSGEPLFAEPDTYRIPITVTLVP